MVLPGGDFIDHSLLLLRVLRKMHPQDDVPHEEHPENTLPMRVLRYLISSITHPLSINRAYKVLYEEASFSLIVDN